MATASPLLALRLCGQDHALECNRDYLLGSGAACDLRLPAGAAPAHARLSVTERGVELVDLGSAPGTRHNGARVERAILAAGDVLHFGDEGLTATVVPDDGQAAIVPIPELRAAAVARRLGEVRVAAMALRRPYAETFHDRMANELRRAPWLAVSLLLHVIVLLVFWLLAPVHDAGRGARPTVRFAPASELRGPLESAAAAPEVTPEPSEPVFEPPAVEPVVATPEPPPSTADGAAPRPREPTANASLGVDVRLRAPATDGGGASDVADVGSGGFRQAVGELRRSGLEIVFVFDSTGSMASTIRDTKSTIQDMLAVLRALVPDARVGLVTYRDRGRDEDYLVRQSPLDLDFWRASNFVQFVRAEGGGDLPEDVRAGLLAAYRQSWRPGARRVVVLAGDAPPHRSDFAQLLGETRTFAQNGRSFVHTLVTSPERAERDTHAAFQDIARAGKGICQGLDARDRVLQRVLTLAFGREFDQDLASVVRTVQSDADRIDVKALALVRHGGPRLAAALRQDPVPMSVWNALVRRPRRAVVEQLVDLLGAPDTRESTRHAVAAALQRILGLPLPPIDPFDGQSPTPHDLERLRNLAGRIPD